MNKLETQIDQLSKIIGRLREVLEQDKNEYMRDSAIKRFELSFDLTWKSIKVFLEDKRGVICKSPKGCFREAYKQGLVDYDEFWLKMTDMRNATTHIYREEIADDIYENLPKILKYFEKLLEKLSSEE